MNELFTIIVCTRLTVTSIIVSFEVQNKFDLTLTASINIMTTKENLEKVAQEKFDTSYEELDTHDKLSVAGTIGGNIRKEGMSHEDYQEMGRKGGETRRSQMSSEDYAEMGRKGGQARSGGGEEEEE
jgi:hypothetical protein